jgi:hypothetical protein
MGWLYKGELFTTVPKECFGFVYLITNLKTGQKYCGRKQFVSLRRKKVVGKRNRKHITKESDWQSYWGSSKEFSKVVEELGEDAFKREILFLCESKRELGYAEVAYQFKHDVLKAKLANGEYEYYNANIASRWFRSREK